MADERTRRRRRSRRRRTVVIAVTVVVVAAGAGTAWAMSGSGGTSYRVATAGRATIAQTVDADGTLTSQDTATQSFAAAGTVKSVLVRTGERVDAGQTLATLDRSSLTSDVTTAENTLATARQTLADDESGQSSGTSAGSGSSGTGASTSTSTSSATTDAAVTGARRGSVVLVADVSSSGDTLTQAEAAVRAAQKEVVAAQSSLDGYVADLTSACTTSGDTETTEKATPDSSGSVSGTVDATSVVTIADDATTSDNPQTVAAGDSWTFAGLTSGDTYDVVVVPVVDSADCTTAISKVSSAEGSASDTSSSTLHGALDDLTQAIAALEKAASAAGTTGTGSSGHSGTGTSGTGTSGTGTSGTGTPSGSAPSASSSGSTTRGGTTGNRTGSGATAPSSTAGSSGSSGSRSSGSGSSGSSSSSSSTTTVSAARIAADQKSIDAAKAALAVARNNMGLATLTTPISGTVASVGITKGSSVSASSSSDTIVVTTDKALSVPVDVSLADIHLIKVGERAAVTVDGRSAPLAAKVSLIGISNASSSTGSSSEYQVTLVLDERRTTLYDGMGASVSIAVGTADRAISVPISAVTTTGTTSTVGIYAGGKVTTTQVTLGVEGESRVQITKGVDVGDQVVLADLGEALPSSGSDTTTGSSLTGGFGGAGRTGGFTGRTGVTGGGPP